MTVPSDIQCQTCFGDGRPVKVKKKLIFCSSKLLFFCLV